MNIESQIESAIIEAQSKSIKICRHAIFKWENGKPIECNALGAILIQNNKAIPGFPKGWLKELCVILDIDTFWLWRFWTGFGNGMPINLSIGDKDSKEDSVSKIGAKLSKKYCQ